MNEGVFFGAFKGFILNTAQLGLVLYPSVIFANKSNSDSKFETFLSTYTFFDALFYPVDTLKNILYADTLGSYCNDRFIKQSKQYQITSLSKIYTKESFINFHITLLSFQGSIARLKQATNYKLPLVGL